MNIPLSCTSNVYISLHAVCAQHTTMRILLSMLHFPSVPEAVEAGLGVSVVGEGVIGGQRGSGRW